MQNKTDEKDFSLFDHEVAKHIEQKLDGWKKITFVIKIMCKTWELNQSKFMVRKFSISKIKL